MAGLRNSDHWSPVQDLHREGRKGMRNASHLLFENQGLSDMEESSVEPRCSFIDERWNHTAVTQLRTRFPACLEAESMDK